MKSFPGTANEGKLMYGSTQSTTLKDTFDIERIKALNLNSSVPVVQEMLKESNINGSNYQQMSNLNTIDVNSNSTEKIYYENPLQLPAELIALAKDYEWVYKYAVKTPVSSGERNGDSIKINIASTTVVPSMFNPMYGVMATGLTRNTPLLNDITDAQLDPNIDDCSIRTLCALSKDPNSILGMARYKYADFMYCKDLGKVANNHLITLRKFAHPVPDHIFEMTSPKYIGGDDSLSFKLEPDVGRLVSWFGTDDNKLEDICRFSYHATWKELTSQIEQKDSKADSENTGIIGMFSNGWSADYAQAVNAGIAGNHSIWGWLGSRILPGQVMRGIGSNNELLTNYDNNKVYTPPNTVQSNHIYEGKLEFSHEFTLNFSYQLRGYDNINPRSALTDLIGNILEVTYRRGKFWGGSRKLIGPAQDRAPFDKVYAFIDHSWDKVGGWMQSLFDGGLSLKSIFGQIGAVGSSVVNGISNLANSISSGGDGIVAELSNILQNFTKSNLFGNASAALKGHLKNALGRPQLYAWQSLLKGDDVGLWHVTIGNPKNPILSIGNLILTNAELSQSGPLGIDDFPSELKVSVTLKHARPRDITDIGRMYTKGASSLYHHFAGHKLSDFFPSTASGTEENANKEDTTLNKLDQSTIKTNVDKDAQEIQKNPTKSIYDVAQNNGYFDPIPSTDNDFKMMRNGTYSDIMLRTSIEEVA